VDIASPSNSEGRCEEQNREFMESRELDPHNRLFLAQFVSSAEEDGILAVVTRRFISDRMHCGKRLQGQGEALKPSEAFRIRGKWK